MVEDGKLKELGEEEWKQKCFERWSWMRHHYNSDYKRAYTPVKMALRQESMLYSDLPVQTEQKESIYETELKPIYSLKKSPEEFYGDRGVTNYPSDFTWEELYINLDLEEYVKNMNLHVNFKGLHDRLDLIGDRIRTFTIHIT